MRYRSFILLLGVLAVTSAWAQNGASITVRISDERKLSVQNASIVLWPSGETYEGDANNNVAINELSAGWYRLEASASDHVATDTAFSLQSGQHLDLNIELQRTVATLREVIIEEDAPAAAIRVLSRRDIESNPARDLATLLHSLNGLDVRDDGGPGTTKYARIGGSNTNQVLVRVDGRKLQDIGSGEADLSTIPLEWVERISIYRGGQTALGSEAIGGIIDITTRNPVADAAYSISTMVHDTYNRTGFIGSGKTGPVSTLLCFERTIGPGDFAYRVSEDDGVGLHTPDLGRIMHRQNNDLIRDQLLSKIQIPLQNLGMIELSGTFDRSARGMPGYLAPQLTPLARQQNQQETINLRSYRNIGSLQTQGRVSFQHDSRSYCNPDPLMRQASTHENSHRLEGEAQVERSFNYGSLAGGVSSSQEILSSEQIAGNIAERIRWSGWFKSKYQFYSNQMAASSASIEPGIRYESFDSDQSWIPQVSLVFQHAPSYATGISLSGGKSYRAPSLYSLFWLDDMATRGNPDLEAELSVEVSGRVYFQTAAGNFSRLEVSTSLQNVKNLIYWKRTFDNYWKPFNLKQAHVQTLDINAEQMLWNGMIKLISGVNWTEARDATDDRNTGGRYLTYRAPRSYRTGITLTYKGARIVSNYRWVSARPVLETNSKWLQEYQLIDINTAFTVAIGKVKLETQAGIENLTNTSYRIVRYAPMPLRQWYVGLKINRG
ncbi:MAG: TonB-dependent receptor [Calditrichota bacterium]